MRFIQTFQHAIQTLEVKLQYKKAAKVVFFATSEKQGDVLEGFSRTLFRKKFILKSLEKDDREAIIEWLFQNEKVLKQYRSLITKEDIVLIGKNMQGKPIKEIRGTLIKIMKGQKAESVNMENIQKRLG